MEKKLLPFLKNAYPSYLGLYVIYLLKGPTGFFVFFFKGLR